MNMKLVARICTVLMCFLPFIGGAILGMLVTDDEKYDNLSPLECAAIFFTVLILHTATYVFAASFFFRCH